MQENSLEDFQKRATYWGAKFERPWSPELPSTDLNLTAEQASLVYETGRAQMAFCPQFVLDPRKTHAVDFSLDGKAYSTTDKKWITQLTMRCAAFRSDTFVNYAYEKSLGMKLPLPSRYPYPLPVYTYFSLANIRPYPLTNIPDNRLIYYPEEIKLNLNEAIKAYKKDVNHKSTDMLISTISQIGMDETLSPSIRTELFISAIKRDQKNIELLKILTNDFISSKHNLENFIDETILLYNQIQDRKIKSHLLRGLAATYSYHLVGKVDRESLKKIAKIQNIFLEEIKLKNNGAFFTSLVYLPTIFSYNEAKNITRTIDTQTLSLIEQQQVANIVILIAFNYLKESAEQWDTFWKQYTAEQKRHLARTMSKILGGAEVVFLFNKDQKKVLQEYLIKNWPASFEDETGVWIYDMRLWFVALLNLQDNHTQENDEVMSCLLAQHPNELERTIYMNQFSFDFRNKNSMHCSSG